MKSFKQYSAYSEVQNLVELALFMEMDPNTLNEETMLNEAFDVMGALEKAGFHVKKGRGLIQMLSGAGKHMSKILWYAVKSAAGDEDAKPILKDLLKRRIKKEELLDFLLKLDQLTLHALTGPIHAIDALTGWHIGPNLHKVADLKNDIAKKIKDAVSTIKNVAKEVGDKTRGKLVKAADYINTLMTPETKALTT